MGTPVQYGQPRRLNALTFFMLLCATAGGYWCWRFFPSYFDAWSVDHLLKEAATSVYKASLLAEPDRTKEYNHIVELARTQVISRVGIHDPELLVNLTIDGEVATVSAEYTVIITHPGITRTTPVHFHREKSSNIKLVKWE